MEELKFGNINELYSRLLPALKSKQKELDYKGLKYIKCEDIWNYLNKNKWMHTTNLQLHEMVNDILNEDNNSIDQYVKQEISKVKRDIVGDFPW